MVRASMHAGRRSWRNLSRKFVAAASIAAMALLVFQISMAGAFRSSIPQLALDWVPADAIARTRLATALAGSTSQEARVSARALALDAIRRDPLSPRALWALGMTEAHDARAAELMQASEGLSLRETRVQVWLAQHSLRNGNLEQAVEHFDTALRTSSSSRPVLFPLLASAIRDPRVEQLVAAQMTKEPTWAFHFAAFLTDNGRDPKATANILIAYLDPEVEQEADLARSLVWRFAAAREFDLAWKVYRALDLGPEGYGDTAPLRDGGFEEGDSEPPFGWIFSNETDLWGGIGRAPNGEGKVLEMSTSNARQGVVASQLVRLPAGTYRLSARVGNVPDKSSARPELRLSCAGAEIDRMLTGIRPVRSGPSAQIIAGQVAIPSGCAFQRLDILLASREQAATDNPWIDDVELERLHK